MEVTTVSPSPTSPTAGDDFCDIDVTNVAIHSVTLLICLCGLVGNGAVLCLLSPTLRNGRIFDLAFTDFLLLLFTVPSALLFLVEDMSCSPILPLLYLSFVFQLSVFSSYWLIFQIAITGDFFYISRLSYLCDLWCPGILSLRLRLLLRTLQYWAFFALFTVIPAVTYLCPSHQQEHCRAALISVYALILLIFAVPLLIARAIDFIKVKRASKNVKLKRRKIVISLIVLFMVLLSLCNFLQQLGYSVVSSQRFFVLNCIHSSIKPFIYFLAGRCWRPCSLKSLRLSLQRVFDEQIEIPHYSIDSPTDTGV